MPRLLVYTTLLAVLDDYTHLDSIRYFNVRDLKNAYTSLFATGSSPFD